MELATHQYSILQAKIETVDSLYLNWIVTNFGLQEGCQMDADHNFNTFLELLWYFNHVELILKCKALNWFVTNTWKLTTNLHFIFNNFLCYSDAASNQLILIQWNMSNSLCVKMNMRSSCLWFVKVWFDCYFADRGNKSTNKQAQLCHGFWQMFKQILLKWRQWIYIIYTAILICRTSRQDNNQPKIFCVQEEEN